MQLPSPSPARATLLALLFTPALVLSSPAVLAQPSTAHPSSAGPPPTQAPGTQPSQAPAAPIAVRSIEVQSADPALPPDRVRAAIARELARSGDGDGNGAGAAANDGVSDDAGWHGGLLQVVIDAERRATVSVHSGQGPARSREVVLPEAPDSALETLALLSASLVRQDADALAAALGRPPADSATATPERAAPTNTPEQPQPVPERPAAAPAEPSSAATEPPADSPEAEETEESDAPVLTPFPANLSLLHPLSLVPRSEERLFHGELGLLYSRVGGIEGIAVNGVALRIEQDMAGLAVSGAWLDAGSTYGLAVAGAAQRGRGALEGMAVSGAVDLRSGDVNGAQVAGAFASTGGTLVGLQLAGAASLGEDIEGAQIAGAVSLGEDIEGAQIAGAFGRAESVRGLQVAGAAALSGRLEGAQIAGAYAGAEHVSGGQISTVNTADSVDGAQVGVVNIGGRVRGAQIGVVNIADEVDGVPLGLVNVVGNGRNQVAAWYGGSRLPNNVALKYSHGPLYTLLAFGFRPGEDQATLAPGAGIGGHIPLWKSLFVELDALWQHEMTIHEPDDRFTEVHVIRGRAALGVEVLPKLSVFAGGGPLLAVPRAGQDAEWEPHVFGGVQVF